MPHTVQKMVRVAARYKGLVAEAKRQRLPTEKIDFLALRKLKLIDRIAINSIDLPETKRKAAKKVLAQGLLINDALAKSLTKEPIARTKAHELAQQAVNSLFSLSPKNRASTAFQRLCGLAEKLEQDLRSCPGKPAKVMLAAQNCILLNEINKVRLFDVMGAQEYNQFMALKQQFNVASGKESN